LETENACLRSDLDRLSTAGVALSAPVQSVDSSADTSQSSGATPAALLTRLSELQTENAKLKQDVQLQQQQVSGLQQQISEHNGPGMSCYFNALVIDRMFNIGWFYSF
jgi:septal ring factor EnvC (AmiA/AmiB activator)